MGNTTLAKNLEATITELGFTDSLSWSTQSSSPPDTNVAHYPRLMYYYHPDYLGHLEYITDLDGLPPALSEVEVYQHFYYTAWSETLLEQKATRPGMNFDSPYRFNGKELDEETGLYYYGARYYSPTVSVWLGVDPLASHRNQVDKSPYAFSWNNPVMLVDPDGRCPECEELHKDPVIGLIHESSGGQIYQYIETRDEYGTVTGAAWTALGGTLDVVDVSPDMESAGSSENNPGSFSQNYSDNYSDYTTGVSVEAAIVEDAAKSAANMKPKLAVNTKTNFVPRLDSPTPYKNLAKGAAVFGGVVGTIDNGIQAYNDFNNGNYVRGSIQAAQGTTYLIGTILLFTPLAPIGGTLLMVTGASDIVEWGIENSY